MQILLLVIELLIIPGLITVALVSIAARYIEQRTLDKLESFRRRVWITKRKWSTDIQPTARARLVSLA